MSEAAHLSTVRRFGSFELNPQTGELRKHGMRLRLSGQPFRVLAVLAEHPGELLTREELHSQLWPADTFVDFDHGLNNAVARIREVLEDSSDTPRYIETIPRRGYRFIAPVSEVRAGNGSVSPSTSPTTNREKGLTDSVPVAQRNRPSNLLKLLLGAAALLMLLTVALFWYRGRSSKPAVRAAIKSVAVLPLKNLSGDPSQEYLADGMTEGLIGRLAHIRDLRVISRTSVMGFKDTRLSVPEIARTLNVDAIVEGSLIRDGNHIRVHAQLIRAASDEHFWAQEYDREVENVLALQSDIAQSIAEKVEATVSGQERVRLVAVRPVAPEVYESYLKGMYVSGFSRASSEKRIAYFQEAIQKDPTFALAYVELAGAYYSLGTVIVGGSPQETRPKAIEAAQKALELDSSLVIPHVLLGYMHQASWQWKDAENEFKRALESGPNDAVAHHGYARWLLSHGRIDEALAWQQRARELDPLGRGGVEIAWILFHARRYDEAIREARTELQVNPDSAWAQWVLSFALICNGQPAEAIPIMEKLVPLSERSPGNVELLAAAHARAGNRTEALRLIEELKQRREKGYIPAGALINPYLALDEYEQAFFWFEEAYKEQSQILQFLKVHPFFDPVRSDPRFIDLQRRVGLN
jgi:TolB-like protein/DNA-binding winged helix-turn-helix (wHTH) protein/tetratricopeptide (TPR) repeat protein